MKEIFIIPLIICLLFFSACTKKENVTPVAKHFTTVDSSRVSDSTVRVPASLYPYTDTFIGTLSTTFNYDINTSLDSNYNSYRYYVTYLSENILVFNSSQMIQIMKIPRYWITDMPDTGILDPDNTFHATLYIYNAYPTNDQGNITVPNGYTFQLSGKNLSVNWDDFYMPIPGICDYSESKGQFNGSLK